MKTITLGTMQIRELYWNRQPLYFPEENVMVLAKQDLADWWDTDGARIYSIQGL